MPAKGSCCCGAVFGAGTIWKLSAATGATIEAFSYPSGDSLEVSHSVAFDDYDAAEANRAVGSTDPTDSLWSRSGPARDWGILTAQANNGGPAHLTDQWFVYGGGIVIDHGADRSYTQGTSGAATIVRDRYDGSVQSHSMTGLLTYAADDYIDMALVANPTSNAVQLRRYEDDLSTVRTNATLAGALGGAFATRAIAFSQAHSRYALYNVTNGLKIIDASDMSTLLGPFAVNGGGFVTDRIYEDGAGGVYAWDAGSPAKIKKFTTSTTPDFDTTVSSAPPTFGGGGNLYVIASGNISRINGSDGTIEWTNTTSTASASPVCSLVHGGRVFTASESGGIKAYNEATGALIWQKSGKGYARLLPDGDYIWAGGEYRT